MNNIFWLLLILLNILLVIFLIYAIYALISGAPFLPSGKKKSKKMLALANLQPTDILMDLGSGDGCIIFLAASKVKKAIGIEINPTLYWLSKIKQKINKTKNIEIRRENLWNTDLSNVDVLTLFFIQDKMKKLGKKIKAEMKPGSRIISNTFSFPGWQEEVKDDKIRVYKI